MNQVNIRVWRNQEGIKNVRKIDIAAFPKQNHTQAQKLLKKFNELLQKNNLKINVQIYQAGSGVWQEINKHFHKTQLLPGTDKDFYIIPTNSDDRNVVTRLLKILGDGLFASISDTYRVVPKSSNSIAGEFYNFKFEDEDGIINDFTLRTKPFTFGCNAEVAIDLSEAKPESYLLDFGVDHEDAADDLSLLIFHHRLVVHGLSRLKDEYLQNHEEKDLQKMQLAMNSLSVLAYRVKTCDRVLSFQDKMLSYETALKLKAVLNDKKMLLALKIRLMHYDKLYPDMTAVEAAMTRLHRAIESSLKLNPKTLDNLVLSHAQTVEKLKNLNQEDLDSANKANTALVNNLIADYELKLKDQQSKHKTELSLLAQNHKTELNNIKEDYEAEKQKNLSETLITDQAKAQEASFKREIVNQLERSFNIKLSPVQSKLIQALVPESFSPVFTQQAIGIIDSYLKLFLTLSEDPSDEIWIRTLIDDKYDYETNCVLQTLSFIRDLLDNVKLATVQPDKLLSRINQLESLLNDSIFLARLDQIKKFTQYVLDSTVYKTYIKTKTFEPAARTELINRYNAMSLKEKDKTLLEEVIPQLKEILSLAQDLDSNSKYLSIWDKKLKTVRDQLASQSSSKKGKSKEINYSDTIASIFKAFRDQNKASVEERIKMYFYCYLHDASPIPNMIDDLNPVLSREFINKKLKHKSEFSVTENDSIIDTAIADLRGRDLLGLSLQEKHEPLFLYNALTHVLEASKDVYTQDNEQQVINLVSLRMIYFMTLLKPNYAFTFPKPGKEVTTDILERQRAVLIVFVKSVECGDKPTPYSYATPMEKYRQEFQTLSQDNKKWIDSFCHVINFDSSRNCFDYGRDLFNILFCLKSNPVSWRHEAAVKATLLKCASIISILRSPESETPLLDISLVDVRSENDLNHCRHVLLALRQMNLGGFFKSATIPDLSFIIDRMIVLLKPNELYYLQLMTSVDAVEQITHFYWSRERQYRPIHASVVSEQSSLFFSTSYTRGYISLLASLPPVILDEEKIAVEMATAKICRDHLDSKTPSHFPMLYRNIGLSSTDLFKKISDHAYSHWATAIPSYINLVVKLQKGERNFDEILQAHSRLFKQLQLDGAKLSNLHGIDVTVLLYTHYRFTMNHYTKLDSNQHGSVNFVASTAVLLSLFQVSTIEDLVALFDCETSPIKTLNDAFDRYEAFNPFGLSDQDPENLRYMLMHCMFTFLSQKLKDKKQYLVLRNVEHNLLALKAQILLKDKKGQVLLDMLKQSPSVKEADHEVHEMMKVMAMNIKKN